MDSKDGVDDIRGQLLGKGTVQFRAQGRPGNRQEELAVDRSVKLELVEELYRMESQPEAIGVKIYGATDLEGLVLCNLVAIREHSGVQTLGDLTVCLLQQLSHQQDHRGCSITGNIILCSSGACNHDLGDGC